MDIVRGEGRFAGARYDDLRKRLRVIHTAMQDTDELHVPELVTLLRIEGVSDKIAREDIHFAAKALGWRVETRRVDRAPRSTWIISPRLQAAQRAEEEAGRSVMRTIRQLLIGAQRANGPSYRMSHGHLGREVRRETGAGEHNIMRYLTRLARDGEINGDPLIGWAYNAGYKGASSA